MKIYYSNDNKIPFKAVSINTKNISKINQKVEKVSAEHLSEMLSTSIERARLVLDKFNNISIEMDVRRKIEAEKPWYKINRTKKINKMEAQQKAMLIRECESLMEEAKKISENSNVYKNSLIQEIEEKYNKIKSDFKNFRKGFALSALKAKLVNNKGFDKIAGYDNEKRILEKYFISEILKEKNGENSNIPNSVLFFGPTGNGKTTFAKAFAKETGCKLLPIKIGDELNEEEIYTTMLEKVSKYAGKSKERIILFIDEFDLIADKTSSIKEKLIKFLSTCSKDYNCTVFATTNHPLLIDLPIEGENSIFSYIVSLDPPNFDNKMQVLKYYLSERIDSEVDYVKLAKAFEKREIETGKKFNISQIQEICLSGHNKTINQEAILEILNKTVPTIDENAQNKYKNEIKKLIKNEVLE